MHSLVYFQILAADIFNGIGVRSKKDEVVIQVIRISDECLSRICALRQRHNNYKTSTCRKQ